MLLDHPMIADANQVNLRAALATALLLLPATFTQVRGTLLVTKKLGSEVLLEPQLLQNLRGLVKACSRKVH